MANCSSNPWLGLKSYSEGKILYGRDKETEELSQKILYNTQTVIYGRSGIGKSSLLKAGVFPILRRNGYFPVYVRFVHEEGQGSYTNQIVTAVDNALKHLKIEDLTAPDADVVKFVEGYKEEIVPANNADGEETMWEFFHRYKFLFVSISFTIVSLRHRHRMSRHPSRRRMIRHRQSHVPCRP